MPKDNKRKRDFPTRLPTDNRGGSLLVEETVSMEQQRRLDEQQGHRKLARVHAREHSEEQQQEMAPEGELQNNIQQHPWLDKQQFDGIDPNVNPAPPLNTDARREFETKSESRT